MQEAVKFQWSTRQLERQINSFFYESDLEQALIIHLQRFLLELGRGFSFVARQKRITFDGRHFRVDLVFYLEKPFTVEEALLFCSKAHAIIKMIDGICRNNGGGDCQ